MVVAFDVPPGYFESVKLDAEAGDEEDTTTLRIHLAPPAEAEWVDGQWNPTVFLCLMPAGKPKQSYCANLDLDRTQALASFGTARLFSESGEQMLRKLTPRIFPPHTPVDVRIVRKGEHVTTSFNGEVIDEGEIGFVPDSWTIGASTGVAKIEVIEEVDAPLGPGEWPTTLEAAVALELAGLSSASKKTLAESPRELLDQLRIGWGTGIRDRLGLARGNTALIEAACGTGCDPDTASMAIMEAVRKALQAPSAE